MFETSGFRTIRTILCIGFVAGVASSAVAQANGYSYAFSGPGVSGSGDVYLNQTADAGIFSVASMTGEVNGTAISGVLPVGTYDSNDNLFYNNDDFLDNQGVGFSLANGANVDIYYDGNNYYFQGDGNFQLDGGSAPEPAFQSLFRSFSTRNTDGPVELDSFTFGPLATPEPSGMVLLGTGLAGLAAMIRRKR